MSGGPITQKLAEEVKVVGDAIEAVLESWNIGTPSATGYDIGVGGGAIRGRHKLVEDLTAAFLAQVEVAEERTITVDMPIGLSIGALREAQGAIFNASTEGVDWERLHAGEANAVSPAASLLLDISNQLEVRCR